ncbi:hypothetical protein [Streptomyces sp. NPDC017673]|uniref:hypothetical protein n=1 Tax=unclassified Streptomyces TaxID=2593676 RepID=UPI00379DBD99
MTLMGFWREPPHVVTDAARTTAGLRLAATSEPRPDPAGRDLLPDHLLGADRLTPRPVLLLRVPGHQEEAEGRRSPCQG